MSLDKWSTTPSLNDMATYFQTGMRPSAVKTAGWDVMADMAQLFNSLPVSGGSANAQTLANARPFSSLTDGLTVIMLPGFANTSATTFAPDGLTPEPIIANGAALAGGELQPTVPALLKYRLSITSWELINPAPAGKNFFIDPCCRVAQIGSTGKSLTTSYQYGSVDLVQCKGTGTAVSAGTITQDTTGVIASAATLYASKIAAATITGTGKVFFRRWIESRDAVAFTNGYGLFSVLVRQDSGSSINAFLTVNAFQSQDSPGTVVQIATGSGSPISVPTGTDTLVTLAIPNMSVSGTCANGFEVILEMDCGAVTTKNFYATDWQACLKVLSQKVMVPRFTDDLEGSMAWYEQTYNYGIAPGTSTSNGLIQGQSPSLVSNGAGFLNGSWRFRVRKAVSPAMTVYSLPGTASKVTFGGSDTAASTISDADHATPTNNTGGNLAAATTYQYQLVADARL